MGSNYLRSLFALGFQAFLIWDCKRQGGGIEYSYLAALLKVKAL